MACPSAEQLEQHIQGQLSDTDLANLNAHFKSCSKCRSRMNKARDNESLLLELRALHDPIEKILSPTSEKSFTKEQAQALLPKQYHVMRKVGQGGAGHVFHGTDDNTGRWIAIKFLLSDENITEERWREARLMGKLGHPNIATIYSAEEKGSVRFIIMEWIEGVPLTEICRGRPLDQKLDIFLKVLGAMSAAHTQGIVHRDIKPSNILVNARLEPKVLDFGISVESHVSGLVEGNIYRGSPPFSSPEQITQRYKITPATDVFSLCILLYELLTEQLPFSQESIAELFEAITKQAPKSPRAINPKIPKSLEKICLKGLEKDPKNRYPNAQVLAEDIIRHYMSRVKRKQGPSILEGVNGSRLDRLEEGPYISGLDGQPFDMPITEGELLIERYRVVRELGRGKGTVYLAHDTRLGYDIALKVVVADNDKISHELFQELRREVLLGNRINDFAHITRTYDVQQIDYGGLSLVLLSLEHANGGSFRSWLDSIKNNNQLRISKGLDLFKQACLGIQALHVEDLAHLNIKPENILLCMDDGKVTLKVTDFGISQNIEELSRRISSGLPISTSSLHYISPEQIDPTRSRAVGKGSDIYSLGIVLFEILDGSLPFQGTPDELKQQHLNTLPPKLKGELAPWGTIVQRCLAKKPEGRYADIGQLIKDLDNLRRGFALSVDVACSKCGHINIDPKRLDCDNCNQALSSSFFRHCPRCTKAVRLDQEDCPYCTRQGVAAYYLLQERKARIEKLKDEDPPEAIELLELVFRDGPGDYAKRAEELIADLNRKQDRIVPLAKKANISVEVGQIEEAIAAWKDVFDLIPRHRVADKQLKNLENTRTTLIQKTNKAEIFMAEAAFTEAQKLLQSCLQLAPNRRAIAQKFRQCLRKERDYTQAYETALKLAGSKMILQAYECVKKALLQAPNSRTALALSRQLCKTIEKTGNLIQEAHHQISWAKFTKASETIEQIKQLDSDNDSVPELKKKLQRIQNSYLALVADAKLAVDTHELGKAAKSIKKALGLCANSPGANSLLKAVETEQLAFFDLLEGATAAIAAAKFGEAEDSLNRAADIWPSAKGLNVAKDKLKTSRAKYNPLMEQAEKARNERNLVIAKEKVRSALSICPKSTQASKLLSYVADLQKEALSLLKEAQKLSKAAEFTKAAENIESARQLWAEPPGVQGIEDQITSTKNRFHRQLSLAKSQLSHKQYQQALDSCKLAQHLCPRWLEGTSFYNRIESEWRQAQKRKERRKQLIRKIFVVILSAVYLPPLYTAKALAYILIHYGKWIAKVAAVVIVGGAIVIGLVLGIKWLFTTPRGQVVLIGTLILGGVLISAMKKRDRDHCR